MKKIIAILVLPLMLPGAAIAQDWPEAEHPDSVNLKVPAEWVVVTDHADKSYSVGDDPEQSDIYFVNMSPGWHITTGPAAIFYPPSGTAGGNYELSSVIHLFEPRGDREAFGIFFGGENLENENRSYSYFLVRNTGEYLVKNRNGSRTEVVEGWSDAAAMNKYTDKSGTSVQNRLTVKVQAGEVSFHLNGQKVTVIPKDKLHTNGIAGLRVNHNINLHIEEFKARDQ